MRESWEQIAAWLAANAPVTYAALRPGASEAALSALQGVVGELPEEMLALLRLSDGAGWGANDLMPSRRRPLSCQEIANDWVEYEAMRDEEEYRAYDDDDVAAEMAKPAGTPTDLWLPQFVPLLQGVAADLDVVDRRSGPLHASVGYFDHEVGFPSEQPTWTSVGAMVEAFARDLARGHTDDGQTAKVEDGELFWHVEE